MSEDRTRKCRVLFLAANPTTATLGLDIEIREVREAIAPSRFRDSLVIEERGAVRWRDIRTAILDFRPHIINFSGHGSRSGELILEDDAGGVRRVQPEALEALLSAIQPDRQGDPVELVVLNACYSSDQATAISTHVDHLVGMSSAISDDGAIAFARAFYGAIGSGNSIASSFGVARAEIIAYGLPDRDVPRHLVRTGAASHLQSLKLTTSQAPASPPPLVLSINQAGGQTAHTINNFGPPKRTRTLQGAYMDQQTVAALLATKPAPIVFAYSATDAEARSLCEMLYGNLRKLGLPIDPTPHPVIDSTTAPILIESISNAKDGSNPMWILVTWLNKQGLEAEFAGDAGENRITVCSYQAS